MRSHAQLSALTSVSDGSELSVRSVRGGGLGLLGGGQGIFHFSLSHTRNELCCCVPFDLCLSLHADSKYCSSAARGNSKP